MGEVGCGDRIRSSWGEGKVDTWESGFQLAYVSVKVYDPTVRTVNVSVF